MITQTELKEILSYDANTGIFVWSKVLGRKTTIGATAGTTNAKGYRIIVINKKLYRAHRLAWLYVYGEWPNGDIDHINHIKTDNRIINLRTATRLENSKNLPMGKINKSGLFGVSWNKKDRAWHAAIGVNNKQIYIGFFKGKFEAACARKSAEIKYGFHINHGEYK